MPVYLETPRKSICSLRAERKYVGKKKKKRLEPKLNIVFCGAKYALCATGPWSYENVSYHQNSAQQLQLVLFCHEYSR